LETSGNPAIAKLWRWFPAPIESTKHMLNHKYNTIRISEQIRLNKLSNTDADLIHSLYSDKENVKFMADVIVNWQGDIEKAKKTISIINSSRKDHVWSIIKENEKIGLLGLENINLYSKSAEIWYILNRKFQKQGIMIFVLTYFLQFLQSQEDFTNIVATCKKLNLASIHLLRKVGFKKTKTADKDRFSFEYNLS